MLILTDIPVEAAARRRTARDDVVNGPFPPGASRPSP